ncbi:macrophage mannose receptor 1-like [Megalobrama amblycephala]|uniref:macrophage mannose receptor 1-like n=1 Tax=Megalobrama amblycephala TaxID=75352 RepID=UPI002014274C|nr:macrophage mannose receptor 1-like [Megalobrama amblycephala]
MSKTGQQGPGCDTEIYGQGDQLIFLLLRLIPSTGILSKTLCDPYRFILIEEPKTWLESQSYCREKHLDLATVQSDEDRVKLKEAADAANFDSFAWTGFYNGILTWRWSYKNEAISYVKWDSLEPDTYRTHEACAFIKKNELWGDTTCLEEKYFFCQTDKSIIAEKFQYIQMSMKWRDAQLYCRTNYIDLATITDDTENKALAGIITDNNGEDAWIGLSKNLWLWSDQTNVSWSLVKWEPGQPDNIDGWEECASAGTEGQMADVSCSNLQFFYCKAPDDPPVRKINLVRVAVKSAGYLNEYAVMAAIEKKVNQMLSEQMMDTGSNVTWRVHPDGKIFHLQENHTQKTTTTTAACEEKEPMES